MKTVSVVDYGMGNLFSVRRALEHLDVNVRFVSTPEQLHTADRLILPGVGAFKDGMQELKTRGLVHPLRAFAKSGKPFLGICLGMQMMARTGEEFGVTEGLGIIEGKVAELPRLTTENEQIRVPNIGWCALQPTETYPDWKDTVLAGVKPGTSAYFVHSYAMQASPENVLATNHFGGHPTVAVVKSGNNYGCQFHPELSAEVGLKIISNFLAF